MIGDDLHLTPEHWLALTEILLEVVSERALVTATPDIKSDIVTRLSQAERVRLHNDQAAADIAGCRRVKVTAVASGLTGWVSVTGNRGTPYLLTTSDVQSYKEQIQVSQNELYHPDIAHAEDDAIKEQVKVIPSPSVAPRLAKRFNFANSSPVMREIAKLQSMNAPLVLCSKSAFSQLVRTTMQEIEAENGRAHELPTMRMSTAALETLHIVSEWMLTDLFGQASHVAAHCKRKTVFAKDIHLIGDLKQDPILLEAREKAMFVALLFFLCFFVSTKDFGVMGLIYWPAGAGIQTSRYLSQFSQGARGISKGRLPFSKMQCQPTCSPYFF